MPRQPVLDPMQFDDDTGAPFQPLMAALQAGAGLPGRLAGFPEISSPSRPINDVSISIDPDTGRARAMQQLSGDTRGVAPTIGGRALEGPLAASNNVLGDVQRMLDAAWKPTYFPQQAGPMPDGSNIPLQPTGLGKLDNNAIADFLLKNTRETGQERLFEQQKELKSLDLDQKLDPYVREQAMVDQAIARGDSPEQIEGMRRRFWQYNLAGKTPGQRSSNKAPAWATPDTPAAAAAATPDAAKAGAKPTIPGTGTDADSLLYRALGQVGDQISSLATDVGEGGKSKTVDISDFMSRVADKYGGTFFSANAAPLMAYAEQKFGRQALSDFMNPSTVGKIMHYLDPAGMTEPPTEEQLRMPYGERFRRSGGLFGLAKPNSADAARAAFRALLQQQGQSTYRPF